MRRDIKQFYAAWDSDMGKYVFVAYDGPEGLSGQGVWTLRPSVDDVEVIVGAPYSWYKRLRRRSEESFRQLVRRQAPSHESFRDMAHGMLLTPVSVRYAIAEFIAQRGRHWRR